MSFTSLEIKQFLGHRTHVSYVAWNLDGSQLYAAGDNSSTLVYDFARCDVNGSNEDRYLHECRGHEKNIEAVVGSRTSPHMFVTCGLDNLINVYDTRTSTMPFQKITVASKCLFADWTPDGSTVGVGTSSNDIHFIDCLTWKTKKRLSFNTEVNQFRWTPDGTRLLITKGDGNIDVLEWPSLSEEIVLSGHSDSCLGLSCDPEGRHCAATSVDTCVTTWDLTTMTNDYTIDRATVPIQQAEYSYDGKYLALLGDTPTIDIVEASSGGRIHGLRAISIINNVAWHPKRFLLAYSAFKVSRHGGNAQGPAACVWGFKR